jgi:hypothetical protein
MIEENLPETSSWFVQNLDSIIITLSFGVIAGVISAITYYFILRIIKPKIIISPYIAKSKIKVKKEITNPDTGETEITEIEEYEYVIKIINKTKSNVEDVSYQLFIMEDYLHGTGKNYTARSLSFKGKNHMSFLVGKKDKNKAINDNCRQIRILSDLEKDWDKKTEWLQFQIISYHSKSGSRIVHTKKYNTPSDVYIKKGSFDTGETFKIIKC